MCVFLELQGAELLVHVEDVVVELGREQQVLQRPHVLLDGDVVLWDGGRDETLRSLQTGQSLMNVKKKKSGSISDLSLCLPLLGLPVNYGGPNTQTWTPHTASNWVI